MNSSFETITSLQYQLKAARDELQTFRSGEKYIRMEQEHRKEIVLSVKLISARSVDLFSGVFQLFSCPVELFYTFQSDSLR